MCVPRFENNVNGNFNNLRKISIKCEHKILNQKYFKLFLFHICFRFIATDFFNFTENYKKKYLTTLCNLKILIN